MDSKKLEAIKRDTKKIFNLDQVHSILLFGSIVKEAVSDRSDIDICVVAPEAKNKEKLANKMAGMMPRRYDICLFELLPLYMKMEIINNHIILFTKDKLDLYEYFYSFRKLWKDQKRRQELDLEEIRDLFTKSKGT